jgi:hypothetical protein
MKYLVSYHKFGSNDVRYISIGKQRYVQEKIVLNGGSHSQKKVPPPKKHACILYMLGHVSLKAF